MTQCAKDTLKAISCPRQSCVIHYAIALLLQHVSYSTFDLCSEPKDEDTYRDSSVAVGSRSGFSSGRSSKTLFVHA